MGNVLATYPSSSNPSKSYDIIEGADGVTYCNCQGWKMRKTCKHLQDYQAGGGVIKAAPAQPKPQKKAKAGAAVVPWGLAQVTPEVFESDEFQSLQWYQGCGSELESETPGDIVGQLTEAQNSGHYVAEPKLDGIWIASFGGRKSTRFWSRNSKEKAYGLSSHLLPAGTILMGELGYGSEHALQRRAAYGHDFMDVFGILMINYKSVMHMDEVTRRIELERFFAKLPAETRKLFLLVPQYKDFVKQFDLEHEGLVLKLIKNGGHPYTGQKTKVAHWIKAKKWFETDMVLIDVLISQAESKVAEPMAEAVICGMYVDGKLKPLTKVGQMTDYWSKQFAQNFKKYKGSVMKIAHYCQFASGALRHPSMLDMREDKEARECVFVPKTAKKEQED